jgi:crotonobetainyl-CoA:carnitine CoA-transferase CaiB-like acyl-CoA transferase
MIQANGVAKQVGSPFHFSDTPAKFRAGGSAPGQHTMEVLQDLGLTGQEIETLFAGGVVA